MSAADRSARRDEGRDKNLEVWLRGPVAGVVPLLQPVAHALLQAREEVEDFLKNFPDALLWERPAGVASVGFHLQHLAGVLERMLTYARGESLNEAQLAALAKEGEAAPDLTTKVLCERFDATVDTTLAALWANRGETLLEPREVGRARLPSTELGLLFHAAEHTQRHVGQLLVTARLVTAQAVQTQAVQIQAVRDRAQR